jgi:hypothetical protein
MKKELGEGANEVRPFLFLFEAKRVGFENSKSKFKVLAYGSDEKEATCNANTAISEYIFRLMLDGEDGVSYGVILDRKEIDNNSLTEKQRKIMSQTPFGETRILFKKFPL